MAARIAAHHIRRRERHTSLDRAFKQARREAQAVLVLGDTLTFVHRRQVTALAARYRLPTMYPLREYVDVGGLIGTGPTARSYFVARSSMWIRS